MPQVVMLEPWPESRDVFVLPNRVMAWQESADELSRHRDDRTNDSIIVTNRLPVTGLVR
jgi:hypothetical protein